MPSKKPIKTLNYDASLQQINWDPTPEELDKVTPPLTRLAKKKSSTLSVRDIKNTTQKQIENEDLFNKNSQLASQLNANLSQLYNLDNENNNNNDNYDYNIEGLFQSNSQVKPAKPTARRPNFGFGKSMSGFSNISNSNDFNNNKSGMMQADNQNLYKALQNSLGYVKVPIDFGGMDIDEKELNNIDDIPNISSRGNSFQQLLKSDPTPALFRGSSSIIDPRMLRKNL